MGLYLSHEVMIQETTFKSCSLESSDNLNFLLQVEFHYNSKSHYSDE